MHMKSNTHSDDEVAKAMRILAEDRARKMEACMGEIQAVLDRYGFDLAVSNPTISLVPKTSKPPEVENLDSPTKK